MRHLIDTDLFFAAIYAGHGNHVLARRRLDEVKAAGWGIAAETYLAAVRLLMNPVIMASGALSAERALEAVESELAGEHPGRVVLAVTRPDRKMLARAKGHRQIMDFWLVQIARESGVRLLTHDAALRKHWPRDTA